MKQKEYQIEKFAKTAKWLLDERNSYRGLNYGALAAQVLSDYANGGTETAEFTEELTERTHRYLQGVIFKEFLGVIRAWAKCYDSKQYDERNEFAVKASKVLCDTLLGDEGACRDELYKKIEAL